MKGKGQMPECGEGQGGEGAVQETPEMENYKIQTLKTGILERAHVAAQR